MATVEVAIRYRRHRPTASSSFSHDDFERFNKITFRRKSIDFLTPLAPLDPITIKSPPKFPDPVSKHDDNSADGTYKVAETESVRCMSTSSSALSTGGLSSSSTEINEDNFTSTATVTAYETTDAPPSNEKSLPKPTDLILYEFNFRRLLIIALGPPFIALICAFLIGFSIDYDLLLNYEWTCGKVLLPSFSRIINLPKERVIWNMLVLPHTTLRPIMVFVNYRICSKTASPCRFPLLHSILVQFIPIFGFGELFFLVLLTVIGEREGPEFHVWCFLGFTVSSLLYLLLTAFLYGGTLHRVATEKGSLSNQLKGILSSLYFVMLPTVFTFFYLYWQMCLNFAYNFFAGLEYVFIFVNVTYHAISILDCNDLYQIKTQSTGKAL